MWLSAEILDSAHYDLDMIADGILINEERYRDVQGNTGVPWFWIGAIHSRESVLQLSGPLAQRGSADGQDHARSCRTAARATRACPLPGKNRPWTPWRIRTS